MTVHIVESDVLKEWVDSMVKQGAKAFVVSTDKQGTCLAPSTKVPLYRVPMCVGENVFKKQNLSRLVGASRLILPITDLDWLSDESISALQKKRVVP